MKKSKYRHIDYAKTQMGTFISFANSLAFEKYIYPNNIKILCCLHVTKETGVFVEWLNAKGFNIDLVASNPLSTDEQVKSELEDVGIKVFTTTDGSMANLKKIWKIALKNKPDYLIDDGGDLVELSGKLKINSIKGCCEETTSGVIKENFLQKNNTLSFPVIAVNNAKTKNLMDNHFGTAQSVLDGIIRSTNEIIAGKNILVCGYGHCGSGIADRAKGLGANVMISEINEIKALQALYDGFEVNSFDMIYKKADIIITATGCINVVDKKHFSNFKNGCILVNAGHSDCEINVKSLYSSHKVNKCMPHYEEFNNNGKRLILLGNGRIINLIAANGHPSEIMSLSYSSQIAGLFYLLNSKGLTNNIYQLPSIMENKIASIHLNNRSIMLTKLSSEQKKYLNSYYENFE